MPHTGTLDRVDPRDAVELYLRTREGEVAGSTLDAHRHRLRPFVEWCEDTTGVEAVADLNGRLVHEYRLWRKEDGGLKTVSLATQLSTLRVFLRFCAGLECAPEGLWDKVQVPTVGLEDNRREEVLGAEDAERVRSHLDRYEYASLKHALFLTLWHTGLRTGAVHSLDLDDFSPDEEWLRLRHRPDRGTTLKNGARGERFVGLKPEAVSVLSDYAEHNRHGVEDDHGREPLFTSSRGRYSKGSMRRTVYLLTQPCYTTGECPHGEDPGACDHREWGASNGCPSSVAPHDVRRGAITNHLLNDVPSEAVSGRMDVSPEVIDRHYDKRSEEDLAEQRRRFLGEV